MPVLRQEVEPVEERVALEDLADLPGDALLQAFAGDAEPVEDLQGALGVSGAGSAGSSTSNTSCEIDRGAEADRAGADDDDGVVRIAPVLVGRAAIREVQAGFALHQRTHQVKAPASTGAARLTKAMQRQNSSLPERP